MSIAQKFQSSRYELKYLLDEKTAIGVRDFVLNYLEPDAHTDPNEGFGYSVHSLYLDSPDLHLCRQTIHGEKNRFKLRLRFYEDRPDTPVFFEVKRRVNDVILKQRAAVWRAAVPEILSNRFPNRSHLIKDDDKNFKALHYFCELSNMINAGPAAYTSYLREAYEPVDSNNYRVTFDRRLMAGAYTGQLGLSDHQNWDCLDVGGVVLELKFTDRFPDWMRSLVHRFELMRTSLPKYVECINSLDRARLEMFGGGQLRVLDL